MQDFTKPEYCWKPNIL